MRPRCRGATARATVGASARGAVRGRSVDRAFAHGSPTGRAALARGDWEARARRVLGRAGGRRVRRGVGGAGLGGLVAVRRGADAARPRGRLPRLPRRGRRRRAPAASPPGWSSDYREFRGEDAVARGWLVRAHRLLDPLPESADHGWLALNEGSFALNVELDPEAAAAARALRRAARARARRRRPRGGRARAGRHRRGDRRPRRGGHAAARRGVGDRGRGGAALPALAGLGALLPDRRLRRRRRLPARDAVVPGHARGRRALGRAPAGRRLPQHLRPRAGHERRLGRRRGRARRRGRRPRGDPPRPGRRRARRGSRELRARQGRADEARALYERAGTGGLLGLGELALHDGRRADAADAAERVLRRLPPPTSSAACPRSSCSCAPAPSSAGSTRPARPFEELERAGSLLGTPYLLGRVRLVAGQLAFARGDHEEARRASEDAIDRLTDASAPYDAAVARLWLSRALAALRRPDSAAAAGARRARRVRGARRRRASSARAEALLAGGAARRRARRAQPRARSRCCGSSPRASATRRSPSGSCSARTPCTGTWRTSARSCGSRRGPPPWPTRRAPGCCSACERQRRLGRGARVPAAPADVTRRSATPARPTLAAL